ncbi:MAG: 23S rRNA (guanosine(2251)-2'-O)-methyltransferase RlmB [Clostridia bacterium]|jgi:23S rRNA (guanosine2251-2'-O)-methyltransferase|nr:23S rRNA (guanosine(2251)-2'-O)-methyltransferase RlmB [Clostridia bacterium]
MEQHADGERELLVGRNAVLEALKSGREINTLLVAKGERGGSVGRILADCRDRRIVIKEVDKRKLDFLCGQGNHQGVAAYVAAHAYAELDDLFALAQARGEAPFFLVCDNLEDPHNLGAVIRTAEAAGAHGVIIPKRHGVGLTWAVAKAAAGALEYMPVARVGNLAAALDQLKARGVWVYAADMDGTPWCDVSFSGGVALIVGAEGSGVSRLLREKSDFIVSLPMKGKINSLNASVAAGILMYEVSRQRTRETGKG